TMTSKHAKKSVGRRVLIGVSFTALSLVTIHPLLRLEAIGAPTNPCLMAGAIILLFGSLGIALWMTKHKLRSRWLLLAALSVATYLAIATFVNGLYAQRWLSYAQQTQMLPAQQILHDDGYLPARE